MIIEGAGATFVAAFPSTDQSEEAVIRLGGLAAFSSLRDFRIEADSAPVRVDHRPIGLDLRTAENRVRNVSISGLSIGLNVTGIDCGRPICNANTQRMRDVTITGPCVTGLRAAVGPDVNTSLFQGIVVSGCETPFVEGGNLGNVHVANHAVDGGPFRFEGSDYVTALGVNASELAILVTDGVQTSQPLIIGGSLVRAGQNVWRYGGSLVDLHRLGGRRSRLRFQGEENSMTVRLPGISPRGEAMAVVGKQTSTPNDPGLTDVGIMQFHKPSMIGQVGEWQFHEAGAGPSWNGNSLNESEESEPGAYRLNSGTELCELVGDEDGNGDADCDDVQCSCR